VRKLVSQPFIIFYRAKPEESRVDIYALLAWRTR
jgi:hypothetical protein